MLTLYPKFMWHSIKHQNISGIFYIEGNQQKFGYNKLDVIHNNDSKQENKNQQKIIQDRRYW